MLYPMLWYRTHIKNNQPTSNYMLLARLSYLSRLFCLPTAVPFHISVTSLARQL